MAEGTKTALRHEIRPRPCWWTALLSSLQVGQAFMEQITCKGHRYCPFSREAIQPGLNGGPGFSNTLLNANYKGGNEAKNRLKKKKECLLLDRGTGFAESCESLSLPPCSGRTAIQPQLIVWPSYSNDLRRVILNSWTSLLHQNYRATLSARSL